MTQRIQVRMPAKVRIEVDPESAAEFRQALIRKYGTIHGHMRREASRALIEHAQTVLGS